MKLTELELWERVKFFCFCFIEAFAVVFCGSLGILKEYPFFRRNAFLTSTERGTRMKYKKGRIVDEEDEYFINKFFSGIKTGFAFDNGNYYDTAVLTPHGRKELRRDTLRKNPFLRYFDFYLFPLGVPSSVKCWVLFLCFVGTWLVLSPYILRGGF